jgi:hypothetical protein
MPYTAPETALGIIDLGGSGYEGRRVG